ncbi:uncharacterized protein LOC114724435 [Neltuma alba]|uniref:uncharacterized protein LOC114724435 n=1 Tax=Neltuma alba TaxID=207710 RepID=UPI0010A3842C|nr:uncharacterized protein LOC114724435 [Prosopis alba]
MLEKTFSTFHVSNVLLQQQYREKGFKKYSELISCLLVAEQNNELLMKNHESHPTGSTPFPEVDVVVNGPTCGRGQGHGRARGRCIDRGRGYGHNRGGSNSYLKRAKNDENHKRKASGSNNHSENSCYRCGGNGYWSRTCHTPKHLVDFYQESLKNKSKGNDKMPRVKTNFVDEEGNFDYGNIDVTHLDIADFFADSNGKIDHLIGDGNVNNKLL